MSNVILNPLVSLDDYNENEGKLAASIKWLIKRVYDEEKDIPDKLKNGVQRDEQVRIVNSLNSGKSRLYSYDWHSIHQCWPV